VINGCAGVQGVSQRTMTDAPDRFDMAVGDSDDLLGDSSYSVLYSPVVLFMISESGMNAVTDQSQHWGPTCLPICERILTTRSTLSEVTGKTLRLLQTRPLVAGRRMGSGLLLDVSFGLPWVAPLPIFFSDRRPRP
jgi:hypothetical protein